MKNLKEILLEKLSIDSITPDIEFPIDGTCDKILEFLKEHGFKEVANSAVNMMSTILNRESNKCFINYNNTIWFADTSKKEVSEDNPIFLIEKSSIASSFSVYIPKKVIVNDNKKAFLEELNKCFNW